MITDRGLAETRIQDIAEACGVSPGLILYYFESKDRLLVEALTYTNDRSTWRRRGRCGRCPPRGSASIRRDRAVGARACSPSTTLLDEWALWLEIWVRALRDPELAKERELLDRRWVQTIADDDPLRPADRRVPDGRGRRRLAMQFGAMIDGMAIQVLLNDTVMTPKRMYDICLDVAERLIGFDGPS